VPVAPVSVAVALADKVDTLTGFWAIDEKPTGSKDPYALRRAALGVVRILLQSDIRAGLDAWFDAQLVRHKFAQSNAMVEAEAEALLGEIADHGVFGAAFRTVLEKIDGAPTGEFAELENVVPDLSTDMLSFFHDRLKVFLRDQGLTRDVIDACLDMPGNDDVTLLVRRATALGAFMATEDGTNLVQGFKRAANILTQAEEKDGVEYSYGADVKFAETDEEKALFAALDAADAKIAPAMQAEDFAEAMAAMAALRAPIDAFFDAVQVNSDLQVVRRNRLNLLSRIRSLCLSVADLARIEG